MPPNIDQITLNFSPMGLLALNVILGFIMFGVALDIRPRDFVNVVRSPRSPLTALFSQFLLLPAMTFGLVWIFEPQASIALGMMLVAACPGGNVSNFITHSAKGNTPLSISITAVSTASAIVMTPFNVAFWASQYPPTAALLKQIALDPVQMFLTVILILGLPLIAGMTLAEKRPQITAMIQKPIRRVSGLLFFGFIVGALQANFSYFLDYIGLVAILILVHNAAAFLIGFGAATLLRLPAYDRRAVTIETGIQNSGLGLTLIFTFFDGLGGMALVAAGWGVWHLISGMTLATFWAKRPLNEATGAEGEPPEPQAAA